MARLRSKYGVHVLFGGQDIGKALRASQSVCLILGGALFRSLAHPCGFIGSIKHLKSAKFLVIHISPFSGNKGDRRPFERRSFSHSDVADSQRRKTAAGVNIMCLSSPHAQGLDGI